MKPLETLVTLWPDMPHFVTFARDPRVRGIRLNTAQTDVRELPGLLQQARDVAAPEQMYFDIKGRQLRIETVETTPDGNLCCTINHPISVDTPTEVLFRAGSDIAVLKDIQDGRTLLFYGGPKFTVIPGFSFHIRDPSLRIYGEIFTDTQKKYLEMAKKAGLNQFMLSYAEGSQDIEEMRSYVGDDLIIAKIENMKGLHYAMSPQYVKSQHLSLLNARGDLFVELTKPHDIAFATRALIRADPDTIVGSRLLLSAAKSVPDCADISEINWLLEIGYHRFMFCDELCLHPDMLNRAINMLQAIATDYKKFACTRDTDERSVRSHSYPINK